MKSWREINVISMSFNIYVIYNQILDYYSDDNYFLQFPLFPCLKITKDKLCDA